MEKTKYLVNNVQFFAHLAITSPHIRLHNSIIIFYIPHHFIQRSYISLLRCDFIKGIFPFAAGTVREAARPQSCDARRVRAVPPPQLRGLVLLVHWHSGMDQGASIIKNSFTTRFY